MDWTNEVGEVVRFAGIRQLQCVCRISFKLLSLSSFDPYGNRAFYCSADFLKVIGMLEYNNRSMPVSTLI